MKNLLKIFLILLAICFQQTCFANGVRFIQVTDVHYRKNSNSAKTLKNAVIDINKMNNIDFVVFTGDNLDSARQADLEAFVAEVNNLKYKYYIVIGNHDVSKTASLNKTNYMNIIRKHSKCFHQRKASYVFQKNGVTFIVVNLSKEVIPGNAGYLKEDQSEWLKKTLYKHRNEPVVIFQHFPLYASYMSKSNEIYNSAEYWKILQPYDNVVSIISGHLHSNDENIIKGIYHISSPALMISPHCYKLIEITPDNLHKNKYKIYTQLREVE